MAKYSIKQLAEMAGVSVRTLHYYDQIQLLVPAFRSEKGYRYYERKELLMLQQILLYKGMGFSLKEIDNIIKDKEFDLIPALQLHKENLKIELDKINKIIETVDKTLLELSNKSNIMKDSEIYEGFSVKEIRSIKKEVTNKWGEKQLQETEERIRKMGNQGWKDTKKKGDEINQLLADLMNLPPENLNVQKAIALHFRHMNLFYEVSKERYLGLGRMYIEDERFKATYENYRKGLANFINEAIKVFCKNDMIVTQ